jgi:hypothetical protein
VTVARPLRTGDDVPGPVRFRLVQGRDHMLEHGLLDGFQRGWRKMYLELLDVTAGPVLAAILSQAFCTRSTTSPGSKWLAATA